MECLTFPADVYFNLHRKLWSVRNRQTGLVERHARAIAFPYGAEMIVNPAGRARVLRTGHKAVHAFIRGAGAEISPDVHLWQDFARGLPEACRVTYRPKDAGHFINTATGEPIACASAVVMIAPRGEPPQVWAVPA